MTTIRFTEPDTETDITLTLDGDTLTITTLPDAPRDTIRASNFWFDMPTPARIALGWALVTSGMNAVHPQMVEIAGALARRREGREI